MKSIHFINKKEEEGFGNKGLRCIDKDNHTWISGYWDFKPDELKELIGGKIYLHRTKSKKSYFGGTVLEVISIERDELKKQERKDIKFIANESAKNIGWSEKGLNHNMAWTSGLVEE